MSVTNGWHHSWGGRHWLRNREVTPVASFKVETASRSPETRAGGLRDEMYKGQMSHQLTGDGEQLGGPLSPPSPCDLPGLIQQQQQQYRLHRPED